MNTTAVAFAVIAGLLLLGVGSSRLSSRLNMPVLLLFLAVGIWFGSFPEVNFAAGDGSAVAVTNIIGTVAMAFIL